MVSVDISIFLVFITDHGKHLYLGMIDTIHATTTTRVIGACREFVYAEQSIFGGWEVSAKLRSVVGQKSGRVISERDMTGYQCICSVFGGEIRNGNSEHTRTGVKWSIVKRIY